MSSPRLPVIVSIATIPSRIGKIRPTLQSLLEGRLVPDEILVVRPEFCVWEDSSYVIPDFLLDNEFCRGVVKLATISVDWGPGNKLLGAIDRIPQESYLCLADDDVQYKENFLADLINAQNGKIRSSYTYYSYRVGGLTVGQGCDGLTFWSRNLAGVHDFADRYVKGTSLIYHDDLWISFFLAARGIRIRSLQPQLNGQLIYEQLLPNNVLGAMTGRLSRDVICRTHLPRLFEQAGMPYRRKVLIRSRGIYDYVRQLGYRARSKIRKKVALLSRRGGAENETNKI